MIKKKVEVELEVAGVGGGDSDHCIEWCLSLDRVYLASGLLCPYNTTQCDRVPRCEDHGHLTQQYYIPFTPSSHETMQLFMNEAL